MKAFDPNYNLLDLSLIHIYQDEIECFPDVFALIERDLRQCKFDSAAMKTVEALDGKL